MSDVDSDVVRLKGLVADLVAMKDKRLENYDRLFTEINSRISDFQKLLDHPPKSDQSRQKLNAGKIEVDDVTYAINDEFKAQTIRVADELELDELEAAKLFLIGQQEAPNLNRSPYVASVIRYYTRNRLLLEALQMTFEKALDSDFEFESDEAAGLDLDDPADYQHSRALVDTLTNFKSAILGVSNGDLSGGSKYWNKCFNAMDVIEKKLQKLSNQKQRLEVVDGATTPEIAELFEFQQTSLMVQHECLGAICSYIVRDTFCSLPDFKLLLAKLKSMERHDIVLIHHFPVIMAFTYFFGRRDSSLSDVDVTFVHKSLTSIREEPWLLRNLQAAIMVIWLSDYSGRDFGVEHDARMATNTTLFLESLKEGAFHFLLSLCKDVQRSDWPEIAASELMSFLLQDVAALPADSPRCTEFMSSLIMKYMQQFINSLITNMPDALRMLKAEEDENRRLLQSRYQREQNDYDIHLERFLMIMAYSYKGFPTAALDFWTSSDSNLYGFLTWAAERQTTPRAASFCELLVSLSENETCANHVHAFLHEPGASYSSRLRRSASLSWAQILRELEFYASFVQDRQTANAPTGLPYGNNLSNQLVEPESQLMVECYLRLLAHMCAKSPEAKKWIMVDSKFPMTEVLLQLCSSSNETRLRAPSFKLFAAMLTDKTAVLGKNMWSNLDQWIYTVNRWQNYRTLELSRMNDLAPFVAIANTVEDAVAFVDLLNALMEPVASDDTIQDSLPFPENLGGSYRSPGINNYIDFTVGKLFGELSADVDGAQNNQILRYKCLKLIATCLSTFNDDLVVLAMASNIKVDAVMQTSSLKAYIRFHPFGRVMEWLFNDRVLQTLFQTAHQDIYAVNNAAPDSPLILSLIKCVEIMHLITKLQSTYLDFVRSYPKGDDAKDGPAPVASSTLASFEDAVLNNLEVVIDLGLYAGCTHADLAIESLKVLEKLSASRKLIGSTGTIMGTSGVEKSKILSMVEKDHDEFRIAKGLATMMEFDERECEAGPDAPAYQLKIQILDFLLKGLKAVPDRPTLAHILLGFTSVGNSLIIEDGGLFSSGNSLFHSIMRLGNSYPIISPINECLATWMSEIRFKCAELIRLLWKSPLTSAHVLVELRACDYGPTAAVRNIPTLPNGANLEWDGCRMQTDVPYFYITSGPQGLCDFLGMRSIFCDYCAQELRIAQVKGMSAHLSRMQNMLLGTTTFPESETMQTMSIFDLFDFIDLDVPEVISTKKFEHFGNLDFSICQIVDSQAGRLYDLGRVEEMMALRMRELVKSGQVDETNKDAAESELNQLPELLYGQNQLASVLAAKREALRSWITLLTVFLEVCDLPEGSKTQFILRAFKAITPKLERELSIGTEGAPALMKACQVLMRHVDPKLYDRYRHSGDASNDMLFQLFRVAIAGIIHIDSTPDFRETCEQVAYVYLRNVGEVPGVPLPASTSDDSAPHPTSAGLPGFTSTSMHPHSLRLGRSTSPGPGSGSLSESGTRRPNPNSNALARNVVRILRLNSDRLIEVLCDDVQSGSVMSRIPAVLLLDSMVLLASHESTDFVIESMSRLNFLGLLVDSIKQIPHELTTVDPSVVSQLLMCYNTILALLLRICSTRSGATHVLSLGLFAAIRESGLFSTDPDIGLEIENPLALRRFFQLMVAIMRIVNTAVISRGTHNERVLQQAREFLTENRSSVVSIMKRKAGIGRAISIMDDQDGGAAGGKTNSEALEKLKKQDAEMINELVDSFVLLITLTDFVDFEEDLLTRREGGGGGTFFS